ncbi:MAG: cell wall hydrolase [Clostridiales bacterium]|nr:cell wall hydrolase [Clostridiales bacterium]
MLVANVILNRVNSKKFPSSIEGVVFQKGQFSPIRDGRYYKVSIKDSTKEAVSRALQGEDYSQGALYFAARQKASSKNMRWFDSKLTYLFRHGGHEFFK